MFPQEHIQDFEKYWQRRKPGTSTAVHYASDERTFFKWANDLSPGTITVHEVDFHPFLVLFMCALPIAMTPGSRSGQKHLKTTTPPSI